MTYTQAKQQLQTVRNIALGKPIKRNTRLFNRGKHIAVCFHQTDIILIHPNGSFTLNSGGYTKTTKDRINEFSPVNLITKNFVWYLARPGTYEPVATFKDGMRVDANGKPLGRILDPKVFCRRFKRFQSKTRSKGAVINQTTP